MPVGGAVVGNSKGFPEKSVVLWWVLASNVVRYGMVGGMVWYGGWWPPRRPLFHWLLLKKKSGCHTGADELLGGGDSVFLCVQQSALIERLKVWIGGDSRDFQ